MEQTPKVSENKLPPIPDKRYFTIGEVSKLCALKPHVLRYWEQEFKQINPSKRRGNRRYYQHKDVILIRTIRSLLYEQGFTIVGARQQLASPTTFENTSDINNILKSSIKELEDLIAMLENAELLIK